MWYTNMFMVFILFASVHTLTDEEVKAKFVKYVMRCSKTNPVNIRDLLELEKRIVPKKTEVKCLLACAYRMEGTMNPKGQYDLKVAYKIAEDSKNGDDDAITRGKKFADLCSKTNDVNVSDGEKGCERAALIFKCVTENASKFGFKS